MIPDDLLLALVPFGEPDVLFQEQAGELNAAERIVGGWSTLTRAALQVRLQDDAELRNRTESAGAIGVGLFRASAGASNSDAPQIAGYQFGVAIYRSRRELRSPLTLQTGNITVPIIEVVGSFRPQYQHPSDGRIAAYFARKGTAFGITAMHVVAGATCGTDVHVYCPHGYPTKLSKFAPGLIDAALVEAPCMSGQVSPSPMQSASPGAQVGLHVGDGRVIDTTVVQTVSTSAQLISAAVPEHFLLSDRAFPGASGSLVAARDDHALHGMYLGSTDCEDRQGTRFEYGFAIGLEQVAAVFDIPQMMGAF